MRTDKREIVLVGYGMVRMSYAYSLLNQNMCDELVSIDIDKRRAEGGTMDLNRGLAFSSSNMKVYAGDYGDYRDGDIVVASVGVAQRPEETRLDLLKRNAKVFQSVTKSIAASGFNGLSLAAASPVDIMTRITHALSGFNPKRVLGTGMVLDTVRLRYLPGEYPTVDLCNVHAYVMGERGNSGLVSWSQAMMSTRPVLELCREMNDGVCRARLSEIEERVQGATYKIIKTKKAIYYGIDVAITRTTRAILGDKNSILMVPAMLKGEYGQTDVCAGMPCIINQNGTQKVLSLSLDEREMKRFASSYKTLKGSFGQVGGLVRRRWKPIVYRFQDDETVMEHRPERHGGFSVSMVYLQYPTLESRLSGASYVLMLRESSRCLPVLGFFE